MEACDHPLTCNGVDARGWGGDLVTHNGVDMRGEGGGGRQHDSVKAKIFLKYTCVYVNIFILNS